MIGLKTVVFLVAMAGMVYVSRASLAVPRSHGFYRFFASETILVLAWLNVDGWFRDPLSWHQLISWCLLAVSVFLVVHAVRLLKQIGKPDSQRNETALIGFERTTALVTAGAYRYIRHPMYSSLFFLGWGIFFKSPSWLDALLSLIATLFLVATARVEEAENIRFFGSAYQTYMQQTKMFIPFLF
jgi:protein-S-isoprenylcysteine O-methyltransferase Ste14